MTTRIAPGVGANLLGQHSAERNQDATAYVGNLDAQVTEELLWELFVQAGPVVNVYVPKDRVTNLHQGYGFVEFRSEEDADYAIKILNMIKLYGKPIRVNKASQDKKSLDVGANLFVGNLDPDVDEKLLYDTFSAFGVIVTNPKIMRDPETGNSRGFGFISYDSFETSDAAIEAMNGQYLCNRQITVSYAYKKDTKGERHGTPAEGSSSEQPSSTEEPAPHPLCQRAPHCSTTGQWCHSKPPNGSTITAPSPAPTICKWPSPTRSNPSCPSPSPTPRHGALPPSYANTWGPTAIMARSAANGSSHARSAVQGPNKADATQYATATSAGATCTTHASIYGPDGPGPAAHVAAWPTTPITARDAAPTPTADGCDAPSTSAPGELIDCLMGAFFHSPQKYILSLSTQSQG
ncbi:hypothetical protein AMTRI_Chr13g92460 [Amborella trichopoda]